MVSISALAWGDVMSETGLADPAGDANLESEMVNEA
jgi:hypothetical protein